MQAMSHSFDVIIGALIALGSAYLGFQWGVQVGEARTPVIKETPNKFKLPSWLARVRLVKPERENVLLDPVVPGKEVKHDGRTRDA